MFTLTSELLLTLFASSWIFVLCQETPELKVKPGEDVTLPCQCHGGAEITFIAWNRIDLKPDDGYLFFFSDNRSREDKQHSSFHGRVELKDPKMKDGDASVILKNVNIKDTGTYECWIGVKKSLNHEPKNNCTIKLKDGHKEGNVGLKVGLPVVAVILVAVAVVGTMLFKKRRGKTPHTGGATDALNPPTSG